MNNDDGRLSERLEAVLALLEKATPDAPQDRASDNPGGAYCENCGSMFVGAADHTLCGRCAAFILAEAAAVNLLRQHGPALADLARRWEGAATGFVRDSGWTYVEVAIDDSFVGAYTEALKGRDIRIVPDREDV